jgi:hypothetical protein
MPTPLKNFFESPKINPRDALTGRTMAATSGVAPRLGPAHPDGARFCSRTARAASSCQRIRLLPPSYMKLAPRNDENARPRALLSVAYV